ncbi:ribonuclease P protein component [Patescibacteria group bacterium]|nr:ribonuclease P protein component [Patescibacteria group bacterium]
MLSKQDRLSRPEFSEYFKSGSRQHSDVLTAVYTPHARLRGAVVVSKKVAKKAHERNTIRRRLYAALERLGKERGLVGVVILVAKPPLARIPRLEQHASVDVVLSRYLKER